MRRRNLRLICFDLDNTLYDYGMAEAEAEAHIAGIIAKSIGLKPLEVLDALNSVKGIHMHRDAEPGKYSRRLWMEETAGRLRLKGGIQSAMLEKEYWGFLAPRVMMFPNTIRTLKDLRDMGFKLACLTDSDGGKGMKLGRITDMGLDIYFDYIIITDETGKNKPAIENWEYLLKISGLKGEECMMVGDHPDVDLVSAKKLGLITIWTKEHIRTDIHFRYVDHEITDIGDLIAVVGEYK